MTEKSLISHQSQALRKLKGVAKLFAVLSAHYGKMWFDQWHGTPIEVMGEVWKKALSGYSAVEIEAGVEACKRLKWPPSLPQFLLLCRPEIDPKAAWGIASRGMMSRSRGDHGDWPKPEIYWAAVRFGAWELINESLDKNKNGWQAALDQASADQSAGTLPDIPPPMVALSAPGQSVTNRGDARQRIREILEMTRQNQTEGAKFRKESHQGCFDKVF